MCADIIITTHKSTENSRLTTRDATSVLDTSLLEAISESVGDKTGHGKECCRHVCHVMMPMKTASIGASQVCREANYSHEKHNKPSSGDSRVFHFLCWVTGLNEPFH